MQQSGIITNIWWLFFIYHHSSNKVLGADLKCKHIEHSFKKELGSGILSKFGSKECTKHKFCNKHYKIQYIEYPPYSYTPTLEPRLKACCGDCVRYTSLNQKGQILRNLSDITLSTINESDFILPVLGNVGKPTMYGFRFIPICSVPDYLYITPMAEPVFTRMINKGKPAIPLIIICLFLAMIAGLITWSFETCFNEEEFPRPFFRGWFEGIWWSFISMTTVGYGDKTPRTLAGRLFAVIWILIGITLFGILTGLLTTGIMSANQPPQATMKKKNVGVLNYRIQDALIVAKHDGNVVLIEDSKEFYEDVITLAGYLKEKKVDGLVLDKLTYIHVVQEVYKNLTQSGYSNVPIQWREYTKSAMEFLVHKTMITEKKFTGDQLSYGMLVKDKEVHEYFHDAVADNRFVFETAITMYISKLLKEDDAPDLFSFENKNFKHAVAVMGTITGIIIILGLFYCWWQLKYMDVETKSAVGDIPQRTEGQMLTEIKEK